MATAISEILSPDRVVLELESKKKPELIAELVGLVVASGKTSDGDRLLEQVLERESISTTGIGNGIAVPHCLSETVEETLLSFGRKRDGARFDSVDNQPVSIFFLLIGPQGAQSEHLRVLGKLSRYLHDRTFCQALLDAETPEAVMDALRAKEAKSS